MDLSIYKDRLRKLKISHLDVADYTGHSRETVTTWLNGKKPPEKAFKHICEEIEEMINNKSDKINL